MKRKTPAPIPDSENSFANPGRKMQPVVSNWTSRSGRVSLHRRAGAALGMLIAFAPAVAAPENIYSDLPNIGDSSGAAISPEQQQQLGAEMMRQLRQSGVVLENTEITSYLNALGQRLTSNSDSGGQKFTFFVVNEPDINAFAGPGGYIGVNSGLILAAENESELAGVLAHEISHVTQHHLARAFEAQQGLSLPSMAAMLAGILIGTQNTQAGMAAISAVAAGGAQYQINFTRANEKEADRVGIQTLAQSGYDPYGMPRFFERLQKNSRLYGSHPPEFLLTHPVTTNRIAEAEARAANFKGKGTEDSLNFQLIRAKLRVMEYSDPKQVLEDFQRYMDTTGNAPPYKQYEYALLLAEAGKTDEAARILEKLHRKDPDQIAYRLALANVYEQGGNYTQALKLYKDSLALYPNNLTFLLPYAHALIVANQASSAYKLASDIGKDQYDNPLVYKLLAQASEATGRQVEMHEAMSQYYYLNGYTRDAIQQLELASREPGLSEYDSARIDARQKELKTIFEEEKKQKKIE
jgi:predicted Zn-dependent protease